MRTVQELHEDEFLVRFNRDTPLEEIFGDVRIEREGIEILIEPDGEHYVSVDGAEPIRITPIPAMTIGLLIGLGYVSQEEATEKLEMMPVTTSVHINTIRKKVGSHKIVTRKGDFLGYGGLHLENIATYRPKHWKMLNRYRLNTKTGCFGILFDDPIVLTIGETKFMEYLIDNNGVASLETIALQLHYSYDPDIKRAIWVRGSRLNKKIMDAFGLDQSPIYCRAGIYRLRDSK